MTDAQPISTAPIHRRLFVVILMTCSLLLMPVAMLVLLTGEVYRRTADGYQPISSKARLIYGGLLVCWLVAATAKAFLQPGGIQGEWERSADPAKAITQVANSNGDPRSATSAPSPTPVAESGLPLCTDAQVIQTAKEAIDESPAGVTMGVRVRDVGTPQETFYEADRKVRRCVAEALLNNGPTLMTFQILYGPSGNLMVLAQVGDSAVMQNEVDKAKKEEASLAAPISERRASDASNSAAGGTASAAVIDSSEMADICHDAADKDTAYKDEVSERLAGRAVRLGLIAKAYSQQANTLNADSRSRFGASEETTEVLIDTSSATVPPALKKGGRLTVEGRIEDSALWGNVVEGCFVKLKATRITIDGF